MTPEHIDFLKGLQSEAENNRWLADNARQRLGQVAAMLGCSSDGVSRTVRDMERHADHLDQTSLMLEAQLRRTMARWQEDDVTLVYEDDTETVLDMDYGRIEPEVPRESVEPAPAPAPAASEPAAKPTATEPPTAWARFKARLSAMIGK